MGCNTKIQDTIQVYPVYLKGIVVYRKIAIFTINNFLDGLLAPSRGSTVCAIVCTITVYELRIQYEPTVF